MTDYSRTDADLPEGRFANGDTVTLGDGSKWVFAADRWNAVALGSASKTQVVTATPSSGGLGIRASDASPAIALPVEKSTVVRVQVVAGALYVRTPWDATNDAVQCVLLSPTRDFDKNCPVDLGGLRRIPKSTADADIYSQWLLGTTGQLLLAGQGDDAPPQRYNGTTIGGNHRSGFSVNATAAAHGKLDADIGSSWSDGTLQYVLASIVDGNTVRLIETATGATPSLAGKTLTHVSGAANAGAITVSASGAGLQPCLNRRSVQVYLDGAQIDPSIEAVYSGARVKVVESYGIVNPVSHAAWLQTQVGQLASGAPPGDAVAVDVQCKYTWIFAENGSCSIIAENTFLNSVTLQQASWVQAGRPNFTGSVVKAYIPGVSPITVGANTYDFKAVADITTIPVSVNIDSTSWLDAKNPPNRQAHLIITSGVLTIGQVLGHSPLRGITSRGRFAGNVNRSGIFSNAQKNYIHCQTGLPTYPSSIVPAGTVIRGTAYRHTYNPAKCPDASVATWYWDGDEIVVTVDFHKTSTLSTIGLPAVSEGWAVTTIDSTAVTLFSPVVDGGQIAVACTAAYGYAQFRVAPL